MALVLAIEPDLRQATIVKRIVREKALAEVAVVDSRDAALEAIRLAMPDVLLISALLSPRDEDELIAHLRTLDNADHLQTHTIPQLASALMPGGERGSGGLLSAFRRKKAPEPAAPGCDPDIFAEEIRSYLQRAAEKKRERSEGAGRQDLREHTWRAAQPQKAVATEPEPAADTDASSASSWASPFEWKPASSSSIPNPESLIPHPESLVADPEEPLSLMAHLRPPSGVTSLKALRESLAAESVPLTTPPDAPVPDIESVLVAAAAPAPESILEAMPARTLEPVQELAIVLDAAPTEEIVPIHESAAIAEAPQAPVPVVAAEAAPIPAAAPIRDHKTKIKDSGFGILDEGLGIWDWRVGSVGTWARSERSERSVREAAKTADDMYGLLMGLSVPPAVAAVGYGRGCRIRRVRVPAASEPLSTETNGPVILSKQALAELRDHPQV